MNLIEIEKLHFEYIINDKFKLKAENINIEKGKITAILGESGKGKSTILDLVGFIINPYNPKNGIAKFANVKYWFENEPQTLESLWDDENKLNKIKISKLGYMFQHSFFLPEISLEENIGISKLFSGNFKKNGFKKETGTYFKTVINKPLFANDKKQGSDLAKECSGGQKQRFSLFRALAHDPELVFLDEPTGDLDPKTANLVFQELRDWINEKRTILLVTHDLKSALDFADQIYFTNSDYEINENNHLIRKDNKWYRTSEMKDSKPLCFEDIKSMIYPEISKENENKILQEVY